VREKLTLLKTTRLVAVFAAAILLAGTFVGSARAMTLSLSGAGVAGAIPLVGFDLGAETGLNPGDAITIFDSGNVGGISLDSAANVVFTFLGSEAANSNAFDADGNAGVFTAGTAVGTSASFDLGAGLLNFVFTTLAGSATNGGPFGAGLSIAFADLGDGSFIALFGDGAGDSDRDDFAVKIAVSAVPLPAAVWLFLSAILGLVSFTRIRRDQKTA